ncbi:hypothetical protein E5D57_008993 [Metarhizium anisopliae]|nr:hypothetical protein E5D57_008993 [Metarhizium anisopliae]
MALRIVFSSTMEYYFLIALRAIQKRHQPLAAVQRVVGKILGGARKPQTIKKRVLFPLLAPTGERVEMNILEGKR